MSRRVALTRPIRRARRVIDNFESFFARSWIILITELERLVVSFPSRVRGFISSGVIAASTKQSRERHVCFSAADGAVQLSAVQFQRDVVRFANRKT